MKKIVLLIVIASLLYLAFNSGLSEYLKPQFYQELYEQYPVLTIGVFFVAYLLVAAVPAAALMTLLAGAIFGLWIGLVLVSFASSIGAALAFLVSRTLLREYVEKRFSGQLEKINKGLDRDGILYLLTLRLVPLIPFFVINLVMGLTRMKVRTFYWVSQIGMLPVTAIYVNAGAQIGQIEELSLDGILTPNLWIGIILLAVAPFLARQIANAIRSGKVYKKWNVEKPKAFDTNMVVIGAGSAGLVSSYIAAAVKAKVVLIERHKMGGDCLNTGCVPSKALLKSGAIAKTFKRAEEFGLESVSAKVDFPKVMQRVERVISEIEPHDSPERYRSLGVDVVEGEAEIVSPWKVRVGEREITTRNIVLATGASPRIPNFSGLEQIDYLTSDTIWEIKELPEKLLVVGSGPIGCELAQAFQRLGSQVSMVFRSPRLLPKEDSDVAEALIAQLEKEGVQLLAEHDIVQFNRAQDVGKDRVRLGCKGQEVELEFDRVLIATGRQANVQIPGLDQLDLTVNQDGTLYVDEYLRTKYPNIYACGDLVGPHQYTHAASHQAWYVAVNALFSPLKSFRVDYKVMPRVTFTDPEIATVGVTESEAKEQNIEYEVTSYGIDDLDRAIADGEAHGFVKVLTRPGSDKILGATIVGYQAGNLLGEFVLAMKQGIGLNKILGTIHAYPTMIEANKYVAGVWKREHKPEKVLNWVEKFHSWRR